MQNYSDPLPFLATPGCLLICNCNNLIIEGGMPYTDTIHIYYHHDQHLIVSFFQQGMVVEELSILSGESDRLLKDFLQRNVRSTTHLFVFLHSTQVILTESSVPMVFTADDVLQYIHIEQAKLFPMLDEEIYFDFFTSNIDGENKKLVIAACNVKKIAMVEPLLKPFNIHWAKLGIFQDKFLENRDKNLDNINLLPWRQIEKKSTTIKQLKILGIIAIGIGVIMLIISTIFIKLKKHDKQKETIIVYHVTENLSKLEMLKSVNKDLDMLAKRWKTQTEIAHNQARLVKLLMIIESQRPENLVIDSILWNKNELSLKGRAAKSILIKSYFERLQQHAVEGRIKYIGRSSDQKMTVQFEIEANSRST